MSSIRLRLLAWLIGPILLVNLAGASLTYLLAWLPAQQAFDQPIGDTASAIASRLRPGPRGVELDLAPAAEQLLRADEGDLSFFVVRSAAGATIAGDADFPPLPHAAGAFDSRMRGEAVRVVLRPAAIGGQQVQVAAARTVRKRQQTRSAMLRALVPLAAVLTLGLVGLIWFSVGNGLAPLAALRKELNGRGGDDPAPIDDAGVPAELAPLLAAFNGLLGRVREGARAQHDFLADIAHQLRTPLAGLRLQLEWLAARHQHDAESAASLRMMLLANARMIRQTNQLLSLARAEPSRFERTRLEPLDLASLVGESVQHFVDEAGKKGIDLGFELAPTVVDGDAFLLRDLIDNLVDNAIRYTPSAGTVTVSCRSEDGQGVLAVDDSGPGIAPARREAVFARFVRLDDKTAGSGLGLAIVRDIARAHGATVAIDSGPAGGALVSVRFPA